MSVRKNNDFKWEEVPQLIKDIDNKIDKLIKEKEHLLNIYGICRSCNIRKTGILNAYMCDDCCEAMSLLWSKNDKGW